MWNVITVNGFDEWFLALGDDAQADVLAVIKVLEILGPKLGRPYADTLSGSKLPNLKELRIQHKGKPYRVAFAFDPDRQAVLLCGGIKGKDKLFYRRLITLAEKEYRKYLEER